MTGKEELEEKRLNALDRLDVLDTSGEEVFDRITRLARHALNVPMSAISIVDAHRQWFKSIDGFSVSETEREDPLCARAIAAQGALLVEDTASDPTFANSVLVREAPHVRFFAGMPLLGEGGFAIGLLLAMDERPRVFSARECEALTDLARLAMDELELRASATTDSMTGVLSRHGFKETSARAIALALRHHVELSCVVFHVDQMKSINEVHGRSAGNEVLVKTAASAEASLRKSDIFGRLGGAEFAALLPHTDQRGALRAVEKIRAALAAMDFGLGEEAPSLTASFGLASLGAGAQDIATLLERAGKALKEARSAGRDRVVAFGSAGAESLEPARRRVFKGGLILFNRGMSSIECTIRGLSDEGAAIDVYSTVGIPRQFTLEIKTDKLEKSCRILSQSEKHLDVEFLAA